jgi:hypothetical protein
MPFPENSITLGALSKELFENQTRLTHLTVATLGELLPNFLSKLTRLQSLVVRLHNSPMSNDLSEVIPASLSNLTSLAITEPELGQHFKKIYGLEGLTQLRSFTFLVDIQDYFYPTHIFLHLTNLYELCLGRPMDQNYDVPNVSNLKHLTSLKLLNVKEMPTTFLPKVAKLPNIVALEINEWQDTLVEEDIRPFTRLKRLKITNQFLDMVSLSFMEALEEVELSNHVDILKCSRLTRAVFHEVQSVNALVAANLPSLQDLTLGDMNLTAKEARSLSKATQLTRFAIATHPESLYELFPVFSCLSNLREVCIKNTELNQIGEILTSLSDNPNLRVLTIPSLHPRGIYHKEEVKRLAQLTQMRVLNVLGKPVELSKDLKCHVEFWADEPSWSL